MLDFLRISSNIDALLIGSHWLWARKEKLKSDAVNLANRIPQFSTPKEIEEDNPQIEITARLAPFAGVLSP